MIDRFAVLVALVTAAVMVVPSLLMPGEMQTAEFVSDTTRRTFLCIWTLGSLPIAFAMPRVRVGFLGQSWRMPSRAYVVPRGIVRFLLGGAFGQVAGAFVLAVVQDCRLFWFAGSFAAISVAFCAGARPRLRKRGETEWATP